MHITPEAHSREARARARHTKRLLGALGAAGLAALAAAPAASATIVYGGSVKEAKKAKRSCDNRLVPRKRGVAVRRVTSADSGLVRVRLGARRGDWDVAIFDARSKRLVAASSYFGSKELAEGAVFDGQRLVVQACRRKGKARRATLEVRTIALDQGPQEKIQLVRVKAASQAERTRLASSGFDLTEHGRGDYLDVLAHGADDLKRLRQEKFHYEVVLEDVVAADQATLQSNRGSRRTSPGDGTPLEDARAPVMPSGRVAYRHLWDYTEDMKKLVEEYGPQGYVRPITLNHNSLEGKPIQGIEIAKDVKASDGRPVFLQMGIHHAREWPSGEHAIEFGFDLLKNREATAVQFGDRTVDVKSLLENTRTIIVPVVNPDGFNLSREAALDGQQGVFPGGAPGGTIPHTLAYKRKNCRVTDGLIPQAGECAAAASFAGVDPNRNYAGFWGGPGASGDPSNETYWGAAPFSEPETQSVRELVSERQVVTLITNHTYSDLVLRPPGLMSQGEPFDEHDHYKPLGDAMAAENGYASQRSYELYDTTGTTEDWSYYATGGLGFTFEIGKGEGLALTGAGFHPVYPVGVPAEYFGKGPYAGRGNRSAYYIALENTADKAHHSVIRGEAKPGWKLELAKSSTTLTSPRPENGGQPLSLTDELVTTMEAGKDGRFEWHVNPSTRPDIAKGVAGREVDGRPQSQPLEFKTNGQPFVPGAGADVPGTYEEVEFSIPESEDNGESKLRIEYPFDGVDNAADLDLFVFRKEADGSYTQIGSATSDNSPAGTTIDCTMGHTGKCKFEEATIPDLGNGEFKFRVGNWLSSGTNWVGRMTFSAPVAKAGVAPGTESWTLSCLRPDGGVAATRQVTVLRGQDLDVGDACKKPKKDK